MYTDLYLKQKKNRFPIVIFILVFFVISGFLFITLQDASPTRASKKNLITHEIVNMTPSQIGIFWETDQPDEGWILYGTDKNNINQIVVDERDASATRQKRKYHLAIIRNIQPDTEYFYKIISDNEVILKENGENFSVKSLNEKISVSNISPVYGKMVLENGSPASNAMSMVIVGNAFPIVALSSQSGEWLNSLSYIVSKDTLSPVNITDNTPITIQLFSDQDRSMIRSTPGGSRPIPQIIILGNNYSFITRNNILGESSANFLPKNNNQSNDQNTVINKRDFELRYPINNSLIPGNAPIIKGYGIQGKPVKVSINNGEIFSTTTTVDDSGEWNISMVKPLLPGNYVISAESVDLNSKKKILSRNFIIIKSGERVLGEQTSTPSASLTPSRNISPTRPVSVITVTPTSSAAITKSPISNTPTPTTMIMPSPTLQATILPSQAPTPPVSGSNIIPFILGGLGIVLIGIGSAVVF